MSDIIIFLILLGVGYIFGKQAEVRHFARIRKKETLFLHIPTTNSKHPLLNSGKIERVRFVSGNVVISIDYFKRIYASVINFFGGDVVPYESLLDRARREAVIRLKEKALGADEIINLRIETSSINQTTKNVGSVEILAYATAIYYAKEPKQANFNG
ncbi:MULTISPECIES: YbjQ family protein [unclassified Campylobacter]|uniref:YbjQ family protein n=1 Tax=unclassified Campylobacter TaxID=2593542 RepID=UPI0022E9C0F6|nr:MULTISPECIES: heavy metal-binding domain-containing protein [unclassified Campylobacter]MDA3061571.1 YbjQ family protein [Campylobacter sp. JMF_14 EL1]MDA3073323.1 YbjQ family protein [Campylobacter sp. JMF_10 EL2]